MDHLTATENLLTAIETVAKSVVDKVQYDKTLTCTIVDSSAAADGKYIVTDGSTKFAAYSENTSFKSGNVVYVTVPNGDMTEQKVILGRKTSDQTEPFNYKSPFDNLLICSPDLINISGEGVISSVQTNDDTINNIYIGSIIEEDCKKYKNFDRIGVKAGFQTVLPAEKIETGDYGLKIDIGYIDTVETTDYEISWEDGYREDREYYIKNNFKEPCKVRKCKENEYVDYFQNIADENNYYIYKPNFFYYKNYQLDNSLKPRQEEQYYIFNKNAVDGQKYKAIQVYDIENNDLVELKDKDNNIVDKNDWKNYKISTTPLYITEDQPIYFYKPNTFYWIKDKNDDKQYILSTDNGWNSSNKYFIKIDTENNNEYYSSLILDKNNYKPGAYFVLKREEQIFVSTVYLNTKDMIGQPYNFIVPMNQEKVFDISNIQNIKQIDFYLYQDNNFTTLSSEQYQANEDNIFLINLEMYYGYDITDINEEYLQIYTTDPLNYYQAYNSIEDICKKIKLKWVHVVDDESYVIDNDHLNYFSLSAAVDIENAMSGKNSLEIANLLTLKNADQYIYTLKLDNSPTYTENRTYLTRSISFDKNNSTQFLAKFIKNYNEDYNENREYYEKKYLKKSEVSGLSENIIKTNGTFNLVTEAIEKGSVYNEEYKYYTQQGYYGNNIWKSFSVTPDILDDNGLFVTDEYQGNKIYQQYYKAETGEYEEYYFPKKNLDKNNISKLYYLDISIVEGNSGGGNIVLKLDTKKDIDQINYEQGKYYYLEHKNEQNIDIRWYRYKEGAPHADEYSGVYWERIPLWQDEDKPPLGKDYLQNLFELDFYPDPIYHKIEQIKVIAIYNDKPIHSNVLEFTNDDPVINLPTIEQENALRMLFEDQTNGKYFMYNENNQLIDMGNAQQIREITLLFDKDDFTSSSVLNNAEQVQWIIPKNNSMINIADVNDGSITEDDRFYYITDTAKRHEYKFKYTINKMYSFSRDNNTIVCNVFKDGTLYSSTQNLSFGQAGSNGSEYTLVLNLLSSDQVVTLNKQGQNVFYKTFEPLNKNEVISKAIEEKLYVLYTIFNDNSIVEKISFEEYNTKNAIKAYKQAADITLINIKNQYYEEFIPKDDSEEIYLITPSQHYQQISLDEWDQNKQLYTQTKYVNAKDDNGTSADDYSRGEYYIQNNDVQDYVLLNQDTPYPVDKVQAVLYDQNYNKVSIPDSASFQWEWISNYNELEDGFEDVDQILFNNIEETNDIITLQINPNCQEPFEQVCILKVTLKSFGDYDLVSYLPIPIRPDYGPVRYQGPTQVIYSSYGAPNYYTNDIVLYYNNENGELKPYPEQIIEPVFGSTGFYVYQTQRMYEGYSRYTLKDTTNSFTPFLKEQKQTYDLINIDSKDYSSNKYYIKNDQNECVLDDSLEYDENKKYFIKKKQSIVFKPSDLFINDIGMFAIQYYYNNQCLWSQPILYMQNRYFSSTLNKWDGKLSVDDQQNTILAKSMAAGRKESDNSFSGLIMGDWSETNKIGSANENFDITKSTGLYAFNHGATSFGLNDNGQMFLGKSGRGRIYFNGENATICSADWYKKGGDGIGNIRGTGNGLLLDIDDGFLISRNSDGQYIKIDSLANQNSAGKVKEFIGKNDDCDHPDNDPYYEPNENPTAGGMENEYPFVVYGNKDNFTAIGWRGNLLLHGTQPDNKGGSISLNASARYLPINVNQHFGVGWNGALIISEDDVGSVIADNYQDFGGSGGTVPSTIIKYNDYPTNSTDANHENGNKYDYTELQYSDGKYGFNGLYATPYGDLYLSRKLIIGDEFSVTGEGYLKASNALFDQCNANTFLLKYTPYLLADTNGKAYTRNQFLREHYGNNAYTPTMGVFGYVPGAIVNANREELQTYNVGISSLGEFGIKIASNTNISINARTSTEDLTETKVKTQFIEANKEGGFKGSADYNSSGGIYLESQKAQITTFKDLVLQHAEGPSGTQGNNRISIYSSNELVQRGGHIVLKLNSNSSGDTASYGWQDIDNTEQLILENGAIQLSLGGHDTEVNEYEANEDGEFVKTIEGNIETYDNDTSYSKKEYKWNESNNNVQRYSQKEKQQSNNTYTNGTAKILLGKKIDSNSNIIDDPIFDADSNKERKNRIEMYTIDPGTSNVGNLILLDKTNENGKYTTDEKNRDLIKIASQNEVLLMAGYLMNKEGIDPDYNFNTWTGDNVSANFLRIEDNGSSKLRAGAQIYLQTGQNHICLQNNQSIDNGQATNKSAYLELYSNSEIDIKIKSKTEDSLASFYMVGEEKHIEFTATASNQHGIYARFA